MADSNRTGTTFVVDTQDGARSPFLRGVLTHHLMQRGMEFDDAYALASALKSRIADRDEISTSELRDLVTEQIETRFGSSHPFTEGLQGLSVSYGGDAQPFSKGLLAQSLFATGLDTHRAYERVLEIEDGLRQDSVLRIDNTELATRVEEHLRRFEGESVARRYHLLRTVRGLPKPLVVYVGGVSGTGKSTVALEVAPMLRIYRINSTDTIRQVMRMMFSKAMLPALHRSTFEPEPDQEHLGTHASLEEQATRVCVGVRAVVERAIAENLSIFVEGVHLFPPHVPFPDLDGAAYQLYVLMTTLDEEVHRSHLLSRAQHSARPAVRYLDHLETIREHQHLLIERTTDAGHPIVDTSDRESSSRETARVIIDHLEERLPRTSSSLDGPAKTVLLLIDGLPDRPLRSLGGRTPLEAAHTPTLDRLAREGVSGLADPVGEGIVPDTAAGTLAAFGVSPHSMKRGPIEAMGAGLELGDQDIAWRGNLASLDDNGLIMDRRAGRIRTDAKELAAAVDGMVIDLAGGPVEILARAATEHRVALVFRGDDLSSQLKGTDPGDAAPKGPALEPQPHPGHPEAERTAEALARFTAEAHRLLDAHPINQRRREAGLPPGNGILTRGPGRYHPLKPHEIAGRPLRLACVAGDLTVLGVARALGGHAVSSEAFTANLDTRLDRKFEDAARLLDSRDLVVVHFKGADIAAHDLRVDEKVRFLERLDRELAVFFEHPAVRAFSKQGRLRVLVAADHATYSESGQHGPDPVPVLIHGAGIAPDAVALFNERAAATGMLARFPLQQLVPRVLGGALHREVI